MNEKNLDDVSEYDLKAEMRRAEIRKVMAETALVEAQRRQVELHIEIDRKANNG